MFSEPVVRRQQEHLPIVYLVYWQGTQQGHCMSPLIYLQGGDVQTVGISVCTSTESHFWLSFSMVRLQQAHARISCIRCCFVRRLLFLWLH